jgi:aspartokinase/homoserine dehydrogenase 1
MRTQHKTQNTKIDVSLIYVSDTSYKEEEKMEQDEPTPKRWSGFANQEWQVHKFGGTSVANANCFQQVAAIVEEQIASEDDSLHICVVVSAMGGKPKVTDLLLQSVEAASQRNPKGVEQALNFVLQKHETCLKELCLQDIFQKQDEENFLQKIKSDLNDIRDILKTVSLMKWQAKRISELVSGYGELWSAQILATLLQRRSNGNHHDYIYMDARRIITIDEEAVQDGAVVWDASKAKLEVAHAEELARTNSKNKMHLVCTGYVASNTEGVATTLQRDGSDYSAAIMGRLLLSTQICIWTDVNGVLSADPRRVPHAHPVPEVSYSEAMELAYFGAKVIHPK